MNAYPTPHINASPSDIAKTILMPGDPLRAEFIAKEFLEGAVLFNNVRGIQGYTGTWKGTRVSVMASGMGMPSMGIYSNELYRVFGVENILRVGSAGAISETVQLGDIILGMGACTNSRFGDQFGMPGTLCPVADYRLLRTAADTAERMGLSVQVGTLFSTDNFYTEVPGGDLIWAKMGVLAVEMEAAALYLNAARFGKRALAICTVSDHLATGTGLSVEQRQTGFADMITAALNTAAAMEEVPGETEKGNGL